jgi:RHS repeat-associated protein
VVTDTRSCTEHYLQTEVDRFITVETFSRVVGVRFSVSGGQTLYLKDIKFSNSITVEHNTLGGGAIGHIVRNRRVEANTAVLTDTWFHYDQVGSVLSESDASGNLVATHYQDAFGVRQADWETGLPGGVGEGWAHNTKELDGGTGLMYMYQRHYIPEYGQFMSRAPYEVVYEHEYGFAEQNPTAKSDPSGEIVWVIPIIVGGAILATGCGSSNSNQKTNNPCILGSGKVIPHMNVDMCTAWANDFANSSGAGSGGPNAALAATLDAACKACQKRRGRTQ